MQDHGVQDISQQIPEYILGKYTGIVNIWGQNAEGVW
jgi:hypothetical protein